MSGFHVYTINTTTKYNITLKSYCVQCDIITFLLDEPQIAYSLSSYTVVADQ